MFRICNRVLRATNIRVSKTNRTNTTTTTTTDNTTAHDPPKHDTDAGFARSFAEQQKMINPEPIKDNATFASLLRNSPFIDVSISPLRSYYGLLYNKPINNIVLFKMGDPEGKIVKGEIIHVVNDDLYIDFGWKFYCVCPKPNRNPELYVRGTKVRLMIKDLELSTRFLGSDTDLTLLEADCKLLNVVYSPAKR